MRSITSCVGILSSYEPTVDLSEFEKPRLSHNEFDGGGPRVAFSDLVSSFRRYLPQIYDCRTFSPAAVIDENFPLRMRR